MLREIAGKYGPRYIVGIDNHLDMWRAGEAREGNWEIACADAAKMAYPDGFFDIVISVGVFEHILDLKGTLAEIRRVLKPGGILYTEFSPIWASVTGHHYNFWIEEEAGLVPGWGHLWLSEDQMYSYLARRIGPERAKNACYDIYHGNHINRLRRADYYDLFINCGLRICELKEHVCFSSRFLFNGKKNELTPQIYARLRDKYEYAELAVSGFTMHLEKYRERYD